ncbi:hypothetical protein Q9L58_009412 [Maublancomyces gigas]|uniref:Uncharacterized protein n=1 Tax=Discina gigas TaxID=1032678 RepID=A0ABR3G7H3_9PEZI
MAVEPQIAIRDPTIPLEKVEYTETLMACGYCWSPESMFAVQTMVGLRLCVTRLGVDTDTVIMLLAHGAGVDAALAAGAANLKAKEYMGWKSFTRAARNDALETMDAQLNARAHITLETRVHHFLLRSLERLAKLLNASRSRDIGADLTHISTKRGWCAGDGGSDMSLVAIHT